MKTSVLLVILGIAAITVQCTASESVEQDSLRTFVDTVLGWNAEMASEARCGGWMAKCADSDDCCETFHCTRFNVCGK
uniref:U14-theraphotoxin-Cg1a 3 n=1 Tax=Chilobrachys guangxiensis TaxID=278060 RepID=JZ21C_CHIGU|nr:RecName: Full=U14-theraphotoxin-Cg1a 3; Short=U14-TRTX-Cg1a; AltName: Full=Jingzhaotoxin-21.3; Short=JZTX-21.3; AltName: Full=Peptide F3-11.69; Flags: Precursor [Chilobrachys guangxiensis]ABY71695.1 cystine knot toxin [Chilobrachys guangxiensis]